MLKKNRVSVFAALVRCCLLVGLAQSAHGEALKLKAVAKQPPGELSESMRDLLQPTALQLLDGEDPVFEFWFSKCIALKKKPESPGKGIEVVPETTLLGAVVVRVEQRDYQDGEMFEDVYTMRLGIQPEDGDHMGTSEYPYFALLIPAGTDREVDGIDDHDGMADASSDGMPTGHPVVMSLRPVPSGEGDLPALAEPLPQHKSIRVRVPAKVAGEDEAASIVFDLVYEGVGEV